MDGQSSGSAASSAMEFKPKIFKFAQKMELSDNVFLQGFSRYLKGKYAPQIEDNRQTLHDLQREETSESTWQMKKLHDFLFDIHVLLNVRMPFLRKPYDSHSRKGCALLGNTPFDKIGLTRAFLENDGMSESTSKVRAENGYSYAVVNCLGKAKKPETLSNLAEKHKDTPLVIFDNCENVLKQEGNLLLFKHLCEYGRMGAISCYVFLGGENKLREVINKARPPDRRIAETRVSVFSHFIPVFDFDEKPALTSYELPDEILDNLSEDVRTFFKGAGGL